MEFQVVESLEKKDSLVRGKEIKYFPDSIITYEDKEYLTIIYEDKNYYVLKAPNDIEHLSYDSLKNISLLENKIDEELPDFMNYIVNYYILILLIYYTIFFYLI